MWPGRGCSLCLLTVKADPRPWATPGQAEAELKGSNLGPDTAVLRASLAPRKRADEGSA